MSVRMRHTRAHTGNRRSHHALKAAAILNCKKCDKPVMPHIVCANCGTYKGREVLNVTKKIDKKIKKNKAKETSKK